EGQRAGGFGGDESALDQPVREKYGDAQGAGGNDDAGDIADDEAGDRQMQVAELELPLEQPVPQRDHGNEEGAEQAFNQGLRQGEQGARAEGGTDDAGT